MNSDSGGYKIEPAIDGATPDIILRALIPARGKPEPSPFPSEWTPLNIKSFIQTQFSVCGCSEIDQVAIELTRLLRWHSSEQDIEDVDTLCGNRGAFYLLVNAIERAGLSWHGVSTRFPHLSENGKNLLVALERFTPEEISDAQGEAFDGIYYS